MQKVKESTEKQVIKVEVSQDNQTEKAIDQIAQLVHQITDHSQEYNEGLPDACE